MEFDGPLRSGMIGMIDPSWRQLCFSALWERRDAFFRALKKCLAFVTAGHGSESSPDVSLSSTDSNLGQAVDRADPTAVTRNGYWV